MYKKNKSGINHTQLPKKSVYLPGFKNIFLLIVTLSAFAIGCKKDAVTQTAPNSPSITTISDATLATDVDPIPLNLGTAADFTILSKTGISLTGSSSITGDIGVSPIAATAITGFGLTLDPSTQFSTTPIVTGKVYAASYSSPTPSKMTTAISDMETAFIQANKRIWPRPITEKYTGNLTGRDLPPGLYKWSTGVLINSAGVILRGQADDVWVFQIAQNLTVANGAIVTLKGGALSKNVFWVVSGKATLGTTVNFKGNILSKTLISVNTGAHVTGRLLAQTAVTLHANTIIPK